MTEQEAAKREREAAGQAAGLILVSEDHLSAPIDSHLDAFIEDMRRTGRAEAYCQNTRHRLSNIFRECKWLTLSGIRPDALTNYLARLKDGGAAGKTVNDYLAIAKTFANWCIKQGRLAANPLNGVARMEHVDKAERRALTPDEVGRLLAAASPCRRLVYRAALLTGLRHGELAKLQWGDLHIEPGERPFIALRAKTTKAKRVDTLPLRSDLADELRAARPADADPSERVFPRVPYFQTFHKDREAAKIEYEDRQGRKVVFHSLRVTYGTMLQRAGVPLRTAMMLMRHTDPKLTLNTYTDLTLLDTAGAVEALPELKPKAPEEAQEARAVRTGPDDAPVTTDAEDPKTEVLTKKRAEGGDSGQTGAEYGHVDGRGVGNRPPLRIAASARDSGKIRQNNRAAANTPRPADMATLR